MEKGGCAAALTTAGMTTDKQLAWADEMRVGLVSTVRRVWAPRGVKVRQKVQMVREWRYLMAAVEIETGRLWWCWTKTMKSEETASVVRGWQRTTTLDVVVWDGAPSHRSALVKEVGFALVQQPAYSPELNPAERLFQELRRAVEGRLYTSIEEKMAAIEAELSKWDTDPDRVRRLVDWWWITDILDQLPHPDPIAA